MKRQLIDQMKCPYCLGAFTISHEVAPEPERVRWGLLSCRCFEFPVVDGVLLLSLAKGYGGSEEVLAPYVPLQVAAINYIRKSDIEGLRGWIRRQMPLLHRLISPDPIDYITFSTELNSRLWPQVEKDLYDWSKYEVLGRRGALAEQGGLANKVGNTWLGSWVMRARRRLLPHVWTSFYVGRFISGELGELRTRLRDLRISGPVLSLCCGHGPFELILSGRDPKLPVVCLDGQLLNLFVVKRFVAPDASFVCHDVQFPLPFKEDTFGAVFSSTCLNEIPSQASFIREARRVTAPTGVTVFDGVMPDVARVAPTRFYRVCQNHFERMTDYRSLMGECADGRALHFTPLMPPEAKWTDDVSAIADVSSATFIMHEGAVDSVRAPGQPGFSADEKAMLAVNPRYAVTTDADKFTGKLRFGERLAARLGMIRIGNLPAEIVVDRRKLSDAAYLQGLYESGVVVMVPKDFSGEMAKLF
jgi:SAM-dependent methyltransferase